jgi:hypothetical protein
MTKYTNNVAPNIDVTPNPSAVEVAWAAGLYEGEGHASGVKGRTIAHVTQKDPEVLFRLREMFGGRIEMFRSGTPKYCHMWKLYGDRARTFFQAIYPMLSSRRQEQVLKANGLRFTGKMQNLREPMSPERVARRATMSSREKMLESYLHHRHKNIDRVRATQRAYQARKRAGTQVSEMIQ